MSAVAYVHEQGYAHRDLKPVCSSYLDATSDQCLSQQSRHTSVTLGDVMSLSRGVCGVLLIGGECVAVSGESAA